MSPAGGRSCCSRSPRSASGGSSPTTRSSTSQRITPPPRPQAPRRVRALPVVFGSLALPRYILAMGMGSNGGAPRSSSLRIERSSGFDKSARPVEGFCECGCGGRTSIAKQSDAQKGWTRGKPLRFLRGHANRTKQRPPLDGTDYTRSQQGFATDCWIWSGTLNNKGYGRVAIAGKGQYAHRAMYEQEVGPIPDGYEIDHLCRVRACINPAHLEAVTHSENLRRGHGTKLTDAQREAISRDTRPQAIVGQEYGVAGSTVCRIRNPRPSRARLDP